MNVQVTIFIRLMDEGVECWRPVEAEPRGSTYLLIGPMPSDERWEFPAGSLVVCQQTEFSEGKTGLAVVRLAEMD